MRRPALAAAILVVATPLVAEAHFNLVAPENVVVQDALGNPQKTPPCGGAGTPTGAVTTVLTGSMLAVTINETIFHPGHYRVAIAQTPGELPADPIVTPAGGDACDSAAINMAPTLPTLADGLLVHTAPFGAQQTMMVQLPPGYTCDNCVLQVLEFMSNHGAPCFYYHCSTVTISDTAPPPPDAALPGTPDADTGGGPDGQGPGGDSVGGGCDARRPGAGTGSALLALVTFGLLMRPRRRRN
jgi:hypothetical protein